MGLKLAVKAVNECFTADDAAVREISGAVPKTAALALNNATLPYVQRLAEVDFAQLMREDKGFAEGLNVWQGKVTHHAVANAFALECANPLAVLRAA